VNEDCVERIHNYPAIAPKAVRTTPPQPTEKISASLGLAVRHDALSVNPIQQTSRIYREKTETRSLTVKDLQTVRQALQTWMTQSRPGPKPSSDMADIVDLMLATGARIGEILAIRWQDMTLDATRPNLTINGTIKTEPGKGTYRKPSPKSDASVRTIVLPDFAVTMLQRRQRIGSETANGAVFPTRACLLMRRSIG